ncbi:S-layer homology domain-containing protein, partial [Waterburya agarophytonicola K14]
EPKSTATTPEKTEIPEDIAPTYWAYPFVKQMSDQGLVADLTEDQDFEPDKLITRASMATLISQAFDNKPKNKAIKKFEDVTNKNAIAADIDKAVGMGFMQGYSDDEFRPLENIPRYQVLVTLATGLGLKPSQDATQILQKFGDGSDLPDWAKQQVAAAAEAGLIVNRPNVAANSLSPNKSATRAEVAAMIHQALVKTGKLKPLESEYILKP